MLLRFLPPVHQVEWVEKMNEQKLSPLLRSVLAWLEWHINDEKDLVQDEDQRD